MQVLPDMGIILENAGLYSEFTGRKNLQILADIRKKSLRKKWIRQ